jgi:hypothetical protein
VSYEVIGDPIVFPPLAATFSASVPFDIHISTLLCEDPDPSHSCPPNSISVDAMGQGIATFSFVPLPNFPPGEWALESGIYELQPIPEPGTWLLVPTAVGLAWLARKKRRGISRIKPHATKISASTLRGIVLVMALVAFWPTAAWADTIGVPLTDGTLKLPAQVGFSFDSDSRLVATGPDFSFGAFSGPFFAPPRCFSGLCAPGSSFNANTSVFGAFSGGVTFRGVSQSVNDQAAVAGSAFASWTVTAAPIVMPPIGDPFTVTTPFLLDLTVSLADCATCLGRHTAIDATGAGNATFSFSFAPFPGGGGGAWQATSAVYQINPVPEPSTWLLVPTAVGLAWLARKKRKAPEDDE